MQWQISLENAENLQKMAKNEHLYAEMEHLVKYYNRKLSEDDGALWEMLVALVSNDKELSRRYAAVALRNEYIKLSKAEQKRAEMLADYYEHHGAKSLDIDTLIDLKTALVQLSDKQRDIVLLRYYWGFSVAEIAALNCTSRQAANAALNRALDKLRALL